MEEIDRKETSLRVEICSQVLPVSLTLTRLCTVSLGLEYTAKRERGKVQTLCLFIAVLTSSLVPSPLGKREVASLTTQHTHTQ